MSSPDPTPDAPAGAAEPSQAPPAPAEAPAEVPAQVPAEPLSGTASQTSMAPAPEQPAPPRAEPTRAEPTRSEAAKAEAAKAEPAKPEAAKPADARPEDLLGTTIDTRYRLDRLLGVGGMGAVYRATQVFIGREVALKLLHPAFATHPDLVERFRREAQIAVKLRSPHVVEVLDFGQTQDGRFYLAMEVLEGESLQALLERERRVAPDRASGMLRQLLNGLGAIHAQGIVHRDLKPENLWLVPRPEGALLKILDFGIARLNDLPEGAARTQLGMVLGTPEYLSPEQARGQVVDARADLYNVGLMAFVLLTGRHPFHTGDVAGLLQSHAFAPLPDLTTLVPDLAGVEAWQQFIAIATQKDPAMRAQTAEQLLGLLPGPPEGAGTLIRTGPVAQPLLAELPQGRPGRASIQIEIPTQLHRALSWTRSGAVSAQKRFRALPATQQRVGVGLAAAALLGLAALTFTSRGPLGQVEKALDAGDGEKALRLLEPMGTTPEIECLRGHALHLQRRPDEGLARYKLVADASPALLTKVDPTADLLEDLKGSHSKEVTDLLVTAHATDALLKATQDSESYRRRTAGIDGLRRLHRDDLADSVQIALYDLNVDDCDVQKSAAKRLADLGDKLGDKRGVEPLRALANRKSLGGLVDACAAGAARQALKKLDK